MISSSQCDQVVLHFAIINYVFATLYFINGRGLEVRVLGLEFYNTLGPKLLKGFRVWGSSLAQRRAAPKPFGTMRKPMVDFIFSSKSSGFRHSRLGCRLSGLGFLVRM